MRFAVVLLLVAGCYDPKIPSGGFACNASNNFVCPDGFHCENDVCKSGAPTSTPDGPISPTVAGCADGTREGLRNLTSYPDIAACDSAWTQQGIVQVQPPSCNRQAGNDGMQPTGNDCNPTDACAAGWHVCTDFNDLSAHHGAAACIELQSSSSGFYATRQRGAATVAGECVLPPSSDSNNVYGCGTVGVVLIAAQSCGVLNRQLRAGLPGECPSPWDCGTDNQKEGENVRKGDSHPGGGVLCCRD